MKTVATTLLILAFVVTGCHSTRRGEPIVGPMQLTPNQQRGQIVFHQRCHQCHPFGEAGLGPALNNKPAPVFLMKTQVRAGLGAMPRFDKHIIPDQDLNDLMVYVIALRKADQEKSADTETESESDPSREEEKPDKPSDARAPAPARPTK
jgi:mono/diheme cytochrome c family protein